MSVAVMHMHFLKSLLFTLLVSLMALHANALPVIPNGKGFGMETPAGRGGTIIRVTNLNANGKGSLKAAVDADGPRIVVFEVSGNIDIKGRLTINNPFLTIAGQTAPSPGITLKACTLTVNTHDVLIQHLRVRPGDLDGINPDYRDGINIGLTKPPEKLFNIVIDHCSISWGVDENIESSNCSDITWSNCIISEPLRKSLNSKGPAGLSFLVQNADNIAIIGNIIAHSVDRNPVIRGGVKGIVANNLIYNPGDFNIRISSIQESSDVSIVSNIVIGGKDSARSAKNKLPTFWKTPKSGTRVFLSDNACAKGAQSSPTDWKFVRNVTKLPTGKLLKAVRVTSPPIWVEGFSAMPSRQVKDHALAHAGARPIDRDRVDRRIIEDIATLEGRIIDTPGEVGGWPILEENRIKLSLPKAPHADDNGDGYTNLEEWLHGLAKNLEVNSTPQ